MNQEQLTVRMLVRRGITVVVIPAVRELYGGLSQMAGDVGIEEAAIIVPAGRTVDEVEQLGVVTQRYGSRVVIAGTNAPQAAELRARIAAASVYLDSDSSGRLAADEDSGLTEAELLGLAAFDLRCSADYRARKASRPFAGENWGCEGAQAPDIPGTTPGREAEAGAALGGTSDRLLGSVAVAIVIVEGPSSSGLAFSELERETAVAEVQNGLAWLGNAYQVTPVNWVYEIRDVTLDVPPDPNAPDRDAKEALWRDPAMAILGYPPGLDGVSSYVSDVRKNMKTQWAYCAFFTKYPVESPGYSGIRSPRLVIQYTNNDWGPLNIDRVFAHETCHIFGAPDEYASSGCDCGGAYGYFWLPNLNCENCAPGGQASCIMTSNTDWQMCTYTPRHIGAPKWNIGRNTTASTPFAAGTAAAPPPGGPPPGMVCYFRGTDNKLWRIDAETGKNQQQVGGQLTASTPFVANGVIYWQGTDNTLWRINIDGTNQQTIGGGQLTASSPFVADGVIYWQGTDNTLWRINIDGTNQQTIGGGQLTASTPFVADGVIYWQGTDNTLWRINIDGTNQQTIGGGQLTASTPFVADGVIYWQGTDNKLWRINIDGTNQQQVGSSFTASSPFVANGVIYFQGYPDNKLWRVKIGGTNQQQVGSSFTASSPFVANGVIYWQGYPDNKLWMAELG